MKKFIMQLLASLFAVLLFVNCTKEEPLQVNTVQEMDIATIHDKTIIENSSLPDQLAYKEFHLSSLMEEVLRVNPEFEKMEAFKNGKVENPKYYFETLLKNGGSTFKSDPPISLQAFTNLDGEDWYPVLDRMTKGASGPSNAIYLINSYDESKEMEIVKAYKFDDSGELILFDDDYTEDEFLSISSKTLAGQTAYRMSLAQCKPTNQNQKGSIDCDLGGSNGGSTGGSSGDSTNGTASIPRNLKIERIEIRNKKESWIERADIFFSGVAVKKTSATEFTRIFAISSRGALQNLNTNPQKVTKISQNELGTLKTVNFQVGSESSATIFVMNLYEWDSWPAPKKFITTSLLPYPCVCSMRDYDIGFYRSYQTPYFKRVFSLSTNIVTLGAPRAFSKTFLSTEDNYSAAMKFTDY